ncbi:MAG: hypothetical protein SVR04_00255 [Spirochaetota bacterium]|nr:hypothetical protein [Spirochaetota bacterium]
MGLAYVYRLLNETDTDARFLFGQIEGIGLSDIKTSDAPQVLAELLSEYKSLKENKTNSDNIAERISADEELRKAVMMLIENRGKLSRIMGYIEGITEDQKGDARKQDTA